MADNPNQGGAQYGLPGQQQMMPPPPPGMGGGGGGPPAPPPGPIVNQGPAGSEQYSTKTPVQQGPGSAFNRRGHPKGLKGPPPTFLPPHVVHMFEAPPPLEFKPPPKSAQHPPYSGLSQLLDCFEEDEPPERELNETPKQRKERKRLESLQRNKERIEEESPNWKPQENPDATEDAYKTLFVGRLAYETDERKLKKEMEEYGPVKSVKIVKDTEGKSRGYGFVEFEEENDMRRAYKKADGKRLEGKNIVVDVERGRTVLDWRPRRLGGGLGETRKGGKDESKVYVGREPVGTIKDVEMKKKQANAMKSAPTRSFDSRGPPRGGDRFGGPPNRGRGGFGRGGRGGFDNRRGFDGDRGGRFGGGPPRDRDRDRDRDRRRSRSRSRSRRSRSPRRR